MEQLSVIRSAFAFLVVRTQLRVRNLSYKQMRQICRQGRLFCMPMFYDIRRMRRYLRDKYFDIVWGCHPPPPAGNPPKINF